MDKKVSISPQLKWYRANKPKAMEKTVSIVIPTYNRPQFLPSAIGAALSQTIECEVIVVNDGGDKPTDIPEEVRFFDRPHEGAAKATNFGIQQATGDLIFNLDDDDLLMPFAMEHLRNEIGDYDVIFSDLLLYPSMDRFPQGFTNYEDLIENNTMPGVLMTTREAALKVPFPDLATGWDRERNLQFCEAGLKIKHLPEFLYLYRDHSGQIQKTKAEEQTKNNEESKRKRQDG